MLYVKKKVAEMEREDRETLYNDFVQIVKKEGKVLASPSHTQLYPDEIHHAAILEWQWDVELFSDIKTSGRVVANKKMPAFHVYR